MAMKTGKVHLFNLFLIQMAKLIATMLVDVVFEICCFFSAWEICAQPYSSLHLECYIGVPLFLGAVIFYDRYGG